MLTLDQRLVMIMIAIITNKMIKIAMSRRGEHKSLHLTVPRSRHVCSGHERRQTEHGAKEVGDDDDGNGDADADADADHHSQLQFNVLRYIHQQFGSGQKSLEVFKIFQET